MIVKYISLSCILFIIFFMPASAQLQPTVLLQGIVLDKITKNPISVTIEVFDESGKRINRCKSNSKDGAYVIAGLKSPLEYNISYSDNNYLNYSFDIKIEQTKYTELSKDIELIPVQKGQEFPLLVVPFEKNQSKLRQGAEFFLNDIIKLLKENPKVNITIISYPDDNNDKSKNLELTNQRAEALLEFLTEKGIKSSRLNTEGRSETDPKNPPLTKKRAKGKKYIGTVLFRIK